MSMTKTAYNLEFSCGSSPSLGFLVSTRDHSTPVGISLYLSSFEFCRSLTLWNFAQSASLRTSVAQGRQPQAPEEDRINVRGAGGSH